MEFVVPKRVRYLYKVAFTKRRIVEEQLIGYASKQPAVLFTRTATDTWETMTFGTTFKGGKRRFTFFPNNTYLSKAGNSADAPESIRSVYNYFRLELNRIPHDAHISPSLLARNPQYLKATEALLSFADVGIHALIVQERNLDKLEFPPGFPDEMKASVREQMKWQYLFSHRSKDTGNDEPFELDDESAGTKRLFELAPVLIDALTTGGVMILDELESSMHPFMAELVIKLFNDPRVNLKNGQLIFSTHNVHLMTSELFRRDQIWFAEKKDGVSRYFSLDDFEKNTVSTKREAKQNRKLLPGDAFWVVYDREGEQKHTEPRQ